MNSKMVVVVVGPSPKYDPQRPLLDGDFLGQILAADSLPGAFVHSRNCAIHKSPMAFPNVYAWHSPERNCGDKFFWPGEILGEELGEILDDIFSAFSCFICCAERPTQNFSPNSSQFITPCLVTAPVTEISKFHLRELLGLGVPNNVCWLGCRKWGRNKWGWRRGLPHLSRKSAEIGLFRPLVSRNSLKSGFLKKRKP